MRRILLATSIRDRNRATSNRRAICPLLARIVRLRGRCKHHCSCLRGSRRNVTPPRIALSASLPSSNRARCLPKSPRVPTRKHPSRCVPNTHHYPSSFPNHLSQRRCVVTSHLVTHHLPVRRHRQSQASRSTSSRRYRCWN
jgi:hypothetical protein